MTCLAALTLLLAEALSTADRQYPGLPRLFLSHAPLTNELARITNTHIQADPRLCQRPSFYQQYVVYHEVGHAIAWIHYPDLHPKYEEVTADLYASRLMRAAGIDDTPYLTYLNPNSTQFARWMQIRNQ